MKKRKREFGEPEHRTPEDRRSEMVWNGKERRKQREDGLKGRRSVDKYCQDHILKWEYHDKDSQEHRGATCDSITKLDTEIKLLRNIIVGKYWFRIVVGFLCVGIAFLYTQNKEIILTVNNIENTQIKTVQTLDRFKSEIEALNKRQDREINALNNRQDTLRDAHMKLMEKEK